VSRDRSIVLAAGILAAAILAAISARVFEVETVVSEGRVGSAAAKDPWLALDRVLSPTHGIERYSRLDEVDFDTAALVVVDGDELAAPGAENEGDEANEREEGDEQEKKEGSVEASTDISEWVAAGGGLIIAWDYAPFPDEEEQPSLPDFPALVPEGTEDYGQCRARGLFLGSPVDAEASRSARFPRAEKSPDCVAFYDGESARIALQRRGEGWALAGKSPLFLENRRLADEGNLAFASALLGDLRAGEVWLPTSAEAAAAPSGGGLLARKAFLPVAAAAFLFCLVLLWSRSPRFGPVIPEPPADRRSLSERLRAEGRFLFSHRADASILRRAGAPDDGGRPRASRKRADRIVGAIEARVNEEREELEGR
jgi:hypothetical protein